MHIARNSHLDLVHLAADIKAWGRELGFQQIGIADVDLSAAETHLLSWLGHGRHGKNHHGRVFRSTWEHIQLFTRRTAVSHI